MPLQKAFENIVGWVDNTVYQHFAMMFFYLLGSYGEKLLKLIMFNTRCGIPDQYQYGPGQLQGISKSLDSRLTPWFLWEMQLFPFWSDTNYYFELRTRPENVDW